MLGSLPYPDQSFDAIYSFHVFEHLSYEEGQYALRELHRVLKPGGICRISTPDMLFSANEYIKHAEASDHNDWDVKQSFRYEWAMLNVIDQAVRKKPGGRMVASLLGPGIDQEYLKHVNGDSLTFVLEGASSKQSRDSVRKPTYFTGNRAPFYFQYKKMLFALLRKIWITVSSTPLVELSNERNKWFYDHISLGQQYKEAGFSACSVKEYNTSDIEDWGRYDYDGSVFGDYALEPSLFMEGKK